MPFKQRPLLGNIFLCSISDDPCHRDLLLLGDLLERGVNLGRETCGRASSTWLSGRLSSSFGFHGDTQPKLDAALYSTLKQHASPMLPRPPYLPSIGYTYYAFDLVALPLLADSIGGGAADACRWAGL